MTIDVVWSKGPRQESASRDIDVRGGHDRTSPRRVKKKIFGFVQTY